MANTGRLLLEVEEIAKSFGSLDVLENVSFNVHEGDRIGLVGSNGSGKTTILDLISNGGQDLGEIRPVDGLRMAYVTQVRDIEDNLDVATELDRKPRQFREIEDELSLIESQMADPAFYDGDWQSVMDRYQELQATLSQSGGGDVAGAAKAILRGLGLGHIDLSQKVSSLSGGERAKLALARSLVGLSAIDLLILDEPTNHLDIETCEWLEDFLIDFEGALIVVSHDRYFLDKVCTRIIEVAEKTTQAYTGNYSVHLRIKEANDAADRAALDTIEKKIEHTQQALRHMKRSNKYDKSISSKHKMIEEMQKERKEIKSRIKPRPKSLHIQIASEEKSSNEMVEFTDVSMVFSGNDSKLVFEDLNLEVRKGDRLGIVGPNGSGKTTLLRMILGDIAPTSGDFSLSPGVQIGYFHQDHRLLNFNKSCIQEIEAVRPDLDYGQVRGALGRFRFSKDSAHSQIGDLSGGERARVAILKLLLEPSNMLLLDEPTNHLDIPSKAALEEALRGYEGSMLVISHDRYFLDKIANGILSVSDHKITRYAGGYSEFITSRF